MGSLSHAFQKGGRQRPGQVKTQRALTCMVAITVLSLAACSRTTAPPTATTPQASTASLPRSLSLKSNSPELALQLASILNAQPGLVVPQGRSGQFTITLTATTAVDRTGGTLLQGQLHTGQVTTRASVRYSVTQVAGGLVLAENTVDLGSISTPGIWPNLAQPQGLAPAQQQEALSRLTAELAPLLSAGPWQAQVIQQVDPWHIAINVGMAEGLKLGQQLFHGSGETASVLEVVTFDAADRAGLRLISGLLPQVGEALTLTRD